MNTVHYYLILLFVILFSLNGNSQVKKERVNYDKGTILSSNLGYLKDNVYSISSKPYDSYIVGVATGNILPKRLSDLIVNQGISEVRYNSENGPIHKGDPVTSSSTPGVAMKATQSGMILGVALEDAINTDGLVKVRVLIQYMK